jgi:23S rRNA (adenine2503-C2)-methyltransferase
MSVSEKPFIYDLDFESLKDLMDSWEEPSYRSTQIWNGLYRHLWSQPREFSTLPIDLRQMLADRVYFSHLSPDKVIDSSDGQTQKTLFRLPDGQPIETVRMWYSKRRTLCISTQSGCGMGCVFCATGQMGFLRNLTSGEIIEQVLYYQRKLQSIGERVTNIVVMGMGEPFHNYDATMAAIHRLNDPKGFNLGARRFTVSTVGLIPAIRRFAEEERQVNLAVSLHTTDDELRSSMMPINLRYPVDELLEACREYVNKTHRRITFEWALIRDVNDRPEDAHRLAERVSNMLCHVNVIPLNPTQGYEGQATTEARALAFQRTLELHGVPCTIRLRRGIDIQAGCGQLAVEEK